MIATLWGFAGAMLGDARVLRAGLPDAGALADEGAKARLDASRGEGSEGEMIADCELPDADLRKGCKRRRMTKPQRRPIANRQSEIENDLNARLRFVVVPRADGGRSIREFRGPHDHEGQCFELRGADEVQAFVRALAGSGLQTVLRATEGASA